MFAGELEGLVGEYVAGQDEEDGYHEAAGVDYSDEGTLDEVGFARSGTIAPVYPSFVADMLYVYQ